MQSNNLGQKKIASVEWSEGARSLKQSNASDLSSGCVNMHLYEKGLSYCWPSYQYSQHFTCNMQQLVNM